MQHAIARGERVQIYCPCNCLSYNGARTHGSVIRSASWSLSHSDCLAETAERHCLHGTLSWLQVLCSHNWHKLNINNFTKVVCSLICRHCSSHFVILLARRWAWPTSGSFSSQGSQLLGIFLSDKPVASNSQDHSQHNLRLWVGDPRQTDRQTDRNYSNALTHSSLKSTHISNTMNWLSSKHRQPAMPSPSSLSKQGMPLCYSHSKAAATLTVIESVVVEENQNCMSDTDHLEE